MIYQIWFQSIHFSSDLAAPDHPVYLGLKMTMFGDETWERISPVGFLRSDSTTSFFVSDYSQVSLIHSLTTSLLNYIYKTDMHEFIGGSKKNIIT